MYLINFNFIFFKKKYCIILMQYKTLKCIGNGSFGCVYLAKKYGLNTVYALKRISIYKIHGKNKENLINEIRILKFNRCPYLLRFKDCIIDYNNIQIITEFAKYGDLDKLIKSRKSKKFREETIWSFFIQVCLGVKYLHDHNIIHRDIKTSNIFIEKNTKIILGDFGICKILNNNTDLTRTQIGTPLYISPEIINNTKYSFGVDIWSLGCLLFELINLIPPFMAKNIKSLNTKILNCEFQKNVINNNIYSQPLLKLVQEILIICEKNRLTIDQILDKKEIKEYIDKFSVLKLISKPIPNFDLKFTKSLLRLDWVSIIDRIKKTRYL